MRLIIEFLQENDLEKNPEQNQFSNIIKLPNNIENYITIIIGRNPYKRIVSGFLDLYRKNNPRYRNYWTHDKLTFSMFIDELEKKDWWNMVDYLHFSPQTIMYLENKQIDLNILKSKCIKFYDIENIDYSYIENLYNVKISEDVLNKKHGHERQIAILNKEIVINNYVYDLEIDEYIDYNVDIKYFYNEELKNKVFKFYEDDFNFFYENGIDYINSTFLNL
jgi:hypothetical protein